MARVATVIVAGERSQNSSRRRGLCAESEASETARSRCCRNEESQVPSDAQVVTSAVLCPLFSCLLLDQFTSK